ncbi:MAG: hypothetical protein MJA32_10435 [Proteobacteria bacterium]|nr:hypothetical protein [Pseudomonadota bacterium]
MAVAESANASAPDSNLLLRQLVVAEQAKALWENRIDAAGRIPPAAFLRHVTATVPYYRRLTEAAAIRFSELPITDRKKVAERPQDFQSTAFDIGSCRWKSTSGTSGIPLRIPRDRASAYGFFFDAYRVLTARLRAFGRDLRAGCLAVVLVEDHPDRTAATLVHPGLQYGFLRRETIGGRPDDDVDVVRSLRELRIPLLYGRPRALLRLADIDRQTPPRHARLAVDEILTSGDNLYEDLRERLHSWFGCPVYDAYVSQEAGFAAASCEFGRHLHPFDGRVRFEVLRPDGATHPGGTGELVVTNLENWAMPFVRYRTGDRASVEFTDCRCGYRGLSLHRLVGRDSPYFLIDGKKFNPSAFNAVFERLPIEQFQVLQREDRSLEVRWIPSRFADPAVDISDELMRSLAELAPTAVISLNKVDLLGARERKVQRYVRCAG